MFKKLLFNTSKSTATQKNGICDPSKPEESTVLSGPIPKEAPKQIHLPDGLRGELKSRDQAISIGQMSNLLRTLLTSPDQDQRTVVLKGMQIQVQKLRAACSEGNFPVLSAFTFELGKLFALMAQNPGKVTPSVLRTMTHAVDFLAQASLSDELLHQQFRLRFLAVDDNEICRNTLLAALRNPNVDLVLCSGGKEALLASTDSKFDVVFCDVMMPQMDGFEFISELRKLPNHATTPVVFVTALGDFVTRSKSVISGGCDHVAKPFTPTELLVKGFTFGLRHRLNTFTQSVDSPGSSEGEFKPPAPTDGNLHATQDRTHTAKLAGGWNGEESSFFPTDEPQRSSVPTAPPHAPPGSPPARDARHSPNLANGASPSRAKAEGSLQQQQALRDHVHRKLNEVAAQNGELEKKVANHVAEIAELTRKKEEWEARACERATRLAEVEAKLDAEIASHKADAASGEANRVQMLEQTAAREAELRAGQQNLKTELAAHRAELQRLESALRTEEAARKQAQATLAQMAQEREQLQRQLAEFNLRSEQWARDEQAFQELLQTETQERQRVTTGLTEAIQQRQAAEDQAANLQQRADAQEKSLNQLTTASDTARQREVAARNELENLTLRLQELQHRVDELDGQKEHWQQRATELEQTQQHLQEELKRHSAPVVAQALQSNLEQLQAAQVSLAQVTAQEQALRADLAAAQQANLAQRAKVEELEASYQDATTQLSAAHVQLTAESSQRQRLEARIKELENAQAELTRPNQGATERNKLWQQTIQSLQLELEQSRTRLQKELKEQAESEADVKGRCAALELQVQAAEETLGQARAGWQQETTRRAAAEQKASELSALKSTLEEELNQRRRVEEQLRRESGEQEEHLKAQMQELCAEQHRLEGKIRELRTAQASLAELTATQQTLRAELATAHQANQVQRAKLEELEASHQAAANQLSTVRAQLMAEASQKQRLEVRLKELENAKAELTRQTHCATERDKLWQQTIQSLQFELEQSHTHLQKELKERAAREAELKDQCASLELQVRAVEESLGQARAGWQQETIRRSAAEQKAAELGTLKSTLEDELDQRRRAEEQWRAEVLELGAEQRRLEYEVQALQAADLVKTRAAQRRLASLRYAILGAARVQAVISRSHSESMAQSLGHLRGTLSELLNTPLLGGQKQLVNVFKLGLDDALRRCTEGTIGLQADDFAPEQVEFSVEEVLKNAFDEIRSSAGQAQVEVALLPAAEMPKQARGSSAHVYQLITLLSSSLLRVCMPRSLQVEAAPVDAAPPGEPKLALRLKLNVDGRARELQTHLTDLTAESATLQSLELRDPENGLAVAWQLALAIEAEPRLEMVSDDELSVQISLPLSRNQTDLNPTQPL